MPLNTTFPVLFTNDEVEGHTIDAVLAVMVEVDTAQPLANFHSDHDVQNTLFTHCHKLKGYTAVGDGVICFGSRPSDHYFRSVLSVCLFVCAVFLSRLRSDLDQTRTHVTCPGLVVSPRI